MLNKKQTYNVTFNMDITNNIITITIVNSNNDIINIESKLNNKGEFMIEILSYTIKSENLIQFLINNNYVELISQFNYTYLLKLKSHVINQLLQC